MTPSNSTHKLLDRFDLVAALVAALLVVAAIATCGCATGATNARKAVTGTYTAIGAASVIARPALQKCEVKALADRSAAEMDRCAKAQQTLAKVLPALEDACASAAAAIDAGEAIQQKDFSSALAPVYGAAVELAKALTELGVKIPVSIPGVN